MMTQSKSTLKSVSQTQEVCDKCDKPALIKTYGKTLCANHGLEHLKDLNKIKSMGYLSDERVCPCTRYVDLHRRRMGLEQDKMC